MPRYLGILSSQIREIKRHANKSISYLPSETNKANGVLNVLN